MATNLNVTELDFADIKNNLKNFLKQQSEFNDYDFEGSGLNVLLDVLAYNTHYNALNAHYSLNEAFLDSAQIRGNVVTRAKLLGYTPRSVLSPRAQVDIVVDISNETGTIPTTLTLPRGTKLNTTVSGEEFQFVVLETQTTTLVGTSYTFSNVTIVEGSLRELKYRVDNDIENQKFQLSDFDADASTLRVRVQANQESTSFDVYSKFETLRGVDSTSKVYFLQENAAGYYEIFFGDGVTGFKPTNNNIVTIDYITTQGAESNGANTFTMVDSIGGFAAITVTLDSAASGGAEPETEESIRFNAPLTFIAQNRAVTADDYASIIKKEFSNIDSISTWGGEDNDPPDFGHVYIAIKPLLADTLTESEKTDIIGSILKGKNVVSITPEIVDPNFTHLELDVNFKYNPNLTDRSSVELSSVVRDTITDYNFNNLNKFDGVFRHSQLTRAIDNSDPSILNTIVRPRMFQNITPVNNADNNFDLSFSSPFFQSGDSTKFLLTSTPFKINNIDHFFGDEPITGSTKRNVIVYKVVNQVNITVIANAGEIDVENGKITLNKFRPDTTDAIKITVVPDSLDLAPKRDQLISIDNSFVTITPEIDTIATAGSAGSINYTTTSRLK
jgi:hypothetical protein|tara:strand:+ start:272 stop:2116 length:1845 start_codon:yes stop_codon:yes gene_type:complete